jgi:hypothetical protein
MSEAGKALRATSDALLRDLEAVGTLEAEKRLLAPGSPRLLELSAEIEAIAGRLLATTVRQRELSQHVDGMVEDVHPDAPSAPIEATPREIHVILAEWRDLERTAAGAAPGSPEAKIAADRSDELRAEYRRAHEAARTRGPGGKAPA